MQTPQLYDKAFNSAFRSDETMLFGFFYERDKRDFPNLPELSSPITFFDPKLPDIKTRVGDLMGRSKDGGFLHLEAQLANDYQMGVRTAHCFILIRAIYGVAPRQRVLYMGEEPCAMTGRYEEGNMSFRFGVDVLSEIPAEDLSALDVPGALLISFLCNIHEPETYIDRTLSRLRALCSGTWAWRRALIVLNAFSLLRPRLRSMIKETLRRTAREEDVKMMRNSLFWDMGRDEGVEQGLVQGIEQGLVHGIEQGIEQGLVQGVEQGKTETLKNSILNMRAKGCEDGLIADLLGLSTEEFKRYAPNGKH